MLYQRYFLRMNQSNINHLLSLLLVMIVALTTLYIVFTALNVQSNYHGNETEHIVEFNISTTIEFQQQQQLEKDDYFTTNNLTTVETVGDIMGTINEDLARRNGSRKWQRRKRR